MNVTAQSARELGGWFGSPAAEPTPHSSAAGLPE